VKILTFSGLYGCVMSEGICARWASEWRLGIDAWSIWKTA